MNDIQPITLPGIDPRRPLVIAGPCSAETEEHAVMYLVALVVGTVISAILLGLLKKKAA